MVAALGAFTLATLGLSTTPAFANNSVVSVSDASVTEGNSGTSTLSFTVSLDNPTATVATVHYSTSNGTATAGSDYTAKSGTVAFGTGQQSKTVTVSVNGDTVDEANETLSITLDSPSSLTLGDDTGTGTINNDDATVSVGATTTVAEGGGANQIAVTLAHASTNNVSVELTTADGTASGTSDYTPLVSQVATVTAGLTSVNVPLTINNDTADEVNETFTVTIANPTNAVLGTTTSSTVTITDNDGPPALAVTTNSQAEGDSGTTIMNANVTLTPASGQTVTVDYATSGGSATGGLSGDYAPATGTLTFNPGETTKPIAVTLNGDTTDEADETFTITLSNQSNATLGTASATQTIQNDDATVSIAGTATVTEAAGADQVAVSLAHASTQTVTVQLTSTNGTATSGQDYTALNATVVTINPGVTSVNVPLTINDDALDEADETFTIAMANPTHAVLGITTSSTITITDNDATPTISVSDETVTEGNTGVTTASFDVTLSAAAGRTVTVGYSTADGTATAGQDYTADSGTVTFEAGVTSQTIDVDVTGDTQPEADEDFTVHLAGPSNATIADADGTATITDDDTPTLTIDNANVVEGNAGDANLVFNVHLSPPSDTLVTVDFATSDGTASDASDYDATTGTLAFSTGDSSDTIVVPVHGDTDDEDNETLMVTLSNPSNAAIGGGGIATGTIKNDDDPEVSVGLTTTVDEGGAADNLVVSIAHPNTNNVTVALNTANGTAGAGDYTAIVAQTVTILAGDLSTNVPLTINDDALDEPNETFTATISAPTNASLGNAVSTVTITDNDDPPTISVGSPSVTEGNAGDVNLAFPVTLSAASGRSVSATYTTSNGTASSASDYTADTNTVTIASGTTATVNVAVHGDTTPEPNETVILTLSAPSNATLGTAAGTGTINNDDALVAIATPATADEGTGADQVAVSISYPSVNPVSVTVNTSDGTAEKPGDYASILNGTATIPAGETSTNVPLTIVDDDTNEAAETFTVTISAPVNATLGNASSTVTITDNDAVPTISVGTASVTEGNAGDVNLAFPVTLSAASGQTVSATYTTSNGTASSASDYAAATNTVTIASGTSTTVNVVVHGDTLDEANETVNLTLSAPSNATLGTASAAGTINNDDATVSIAPTATVDEGTGVDQVAVSIPHASVNPVSVTVNTSDGTAVKPGDYTSILNGTATIPAGQTSTNVPLTIMDDALNEAVETFTVTISSPTNAMLDNVSSTVSITDNDTAPTISVGNTSVTEGNSGTVNLAFPVTLSGASGRTVSATYATSDGTATAGSDYVVGTGTVTIASGTSTTVNVVVNSDTTDEANETLTLTLSSPSNATLGTSTATGTINNDDNPTLSISTLSGQTNPVEEPHTGTATMTFSVTPSAPSLEPMTVSVGVNADVSTATATADYTSTVQTLNIPAASTTPVTYTVTVLADTIDEDTETVVAVLSSPTNANLGIASPSGSSATGYISDDPADSMASPTTPDQVELPAAPGGDIETPDAPSPDDPLAVKVHTPNAGTVEITEHKETAFSFTGVQVLPLQINVNAPAATSGNPLVFTFRVDASALTAGGLTLEQALDRLVLFKGGIPVDECTGSDATPDPCLADVTETGGVVTLTVRASNAESSTTSGLSTSSLDTGVFNIGITGVAGLNGGGYWLAAADGGVFNYGNATFEGSAGDIDLNAPIVGVASSPTGAGYWLAAEDGGVFNYGDADFHGSAGDIDLNAPIVGIAPTPTGAGYWLVAADGGVFNYGDAEFFGSAGNLHLNAPIVGITPTPTGAGYWLVAADGGIFNYGDADFHGSAGDIDLNAPVVGIASTSTGGGYWLVAEDGGIFNYGDADFHGSAGDIDLNAPVVGIGG